MLTTKASAANEDTAFVLEAGAGASAPIAAAKTTNGNTYQAVTVKAADAAKWDAMKLAAVTLTKAGK